jgi:hypothetical protein
MKNRPQRTDFEVFMIGDYDASVWRPAPKDYVTSLLTLHSEPDLRQSFDETLPG